MCDPLPSLALTPNVLPRARGICPHCHSSHPGSAPHSPRTVRGESPPGSGPGSFGPRRCRLWAGYRLTQVSWEVSGDASGDKVLGRGRCAQPARWSHAELGSRECPMGPGGTCAQWYIQNIPGSVKHTPRGENARGGGEGKWGAVGCVALRGLAQPSGTPSFPTEKARLVGSFIGSLVRLTMTRRPPTYGSPVARNLGCRVGQVQS